MWLQYGCNLFNAKHPVSHPLSIWTDQDVLRYITTNNIPYCRDVYGEIKEIDGVLSTTKEKRTGCMFCAFGVHLEKPTNRFQRMKLSHPVQYRYCMETLGMKQVLETLGVPYE